MNNEQQVTQVLNRKFCELLFKEGNLDETETNRLNNIVSKAVHLSRWHVPYEIITEYIYSLDENRIDDIVKSVNEKLETVTAGSESSDEEIFKKVLPIRSDTIRHIHLAIVQKQYIDDQLNEAREGLNQIKDMKDSVYSDFIAILGIFTAISFTIVGGINMIGDVLGKIKSFRMTDIGGVVMIEAIYLVGIYIILLALLIGISKLKGNEYSISKHFSLGIFLGIYTVFVLGFYLKLTKLAPDKFLVANVIVLFVLWIIFAVVVLRKNKSN